MALVSSFQINSGFSCSLSNIATAASGFCFMASTKMVGRNLVTQILTLGPTNLSVTILVITSAALSLKPGVSQLQKTSSRKRTAAFSWASRTSFVLEKRAYKVFRAVNLIRHSP